MVYPTQINVYGPLEAFASGFATELRRQGYTANSASLLMNLMTHVSRWLVNQGLDVDGLVTDEVERFFVARRAAGYVNHRTSKALQPMLLYLRGLGVVPAPPPPSPDGPVDVVLERFRCYLTIERGLARGTVRGYVEAVRPFLRSRILPGGTELDLVHLNAADITAFVVARCAQQSPGAASMTVTALRSLLGYLYVEGWIKQSLVWAVPTVPGRCLIGLPKGLSPEELRRLLAACDRRTRSGRRDFAILNLLARLGLRVGEVAALQLDDIGWRVGEIAVHGKGQSVDRLPLPTDVGEALVAYIRRGRPATAEGRSVFVRIRAPHRALKPASVGAVVLAAARRAGLPHIHPHRLRHTVATELLRAGASLPEIGQLLRHRRVLSTAIYAKVDREALRAIARPWPGGDS